MPIWTHVVSARGLEINLGSFIFANKAWVGFANKAMQSTLIKLSWKPASKTDIGLINKITKPENAREFKMSYCRPKAEAESITMLITVALITEGEKLQR